MKSEVTLARPIGGFLELGLLDIPPVPGSIWQAWTAHGRPAMTAWTARAALKRLIEVKRPDHIWLPAYTCRELTTAAPAQGLRFYPLDRELSPKTDFLRRRVRSGDVVLATDFFGWPPNDEFIGWAAERPDVIWIEDRAHCLWMERPPWAPWLLYSPRKLVGVPDGGILISRDGTELPNGSAASSDASRALPELMRFEDRTETDNATWHAAFRAREARFSAEPLPLSRLTTALLQRIPIQPLIGARQRNFRFLAEKLAPYCAWRRPATGIAPFGFAVLTEDAAALSAGLAAEGLFCSRHWAAADLGSDAAGFPWEHSLADHLLTLPCDHRYDEGQLERLASAVSRLIAPLDGSLLQGLL